MDELRAWFVDAYSGADGDSGESSSSAGESTR
jgi:hypothetical protein